MYQDPGNQVILSNMSLPHGINAQHVLKVALRSSPQCQRRWPPCQGMRKTLNMCVHSERESALETMDIVSCSCRDGCPVCVPPLALSMGFINVINAW
jgi:hypothetical protein